MDEKRAFQLASRACKYYSSHNDGRLEMRPFQALEQRWYASLSGSQPDYGVYDEPDMLMDIWACWIVYSRKYLMALKSPKALSGRSIVQDSSPIKSVVDLGCGFGYTTAAFKEMLPTSRVMGTNIKDTCQWRVASEIGSEAGFDVVDGPRQAGKADLIFASEYFEHHEDPISHLREVVKECEPRSMVIANAFGAVSVGHFNIYKIGFNDVPPQAMGRIFSSEMKQLGFRKIKTSLWNQRPAYWKRT